MIKHKKRKPEIPKSINGQGINNLLFTESSYFLARLTKVDKKQQPRSWIRKNTL